MLPAMGAGYAFGVVLVLCCHGLYVAAGVTTVVAATMVVVAGLWSLYGHALYKHVALFSTALFVGLVAQVATQVLLAAALLHTGH